MKPKAIFLIVGLIAILGMFLIWVNTKPSPSSPNIDTDTPQNTTSSSNIAPVAHTLRIPKLAVEAPVVLNVEGNDHDLYLQALENGVAHMARTAPPGEAGNTVIFGHSSYFANQPGAYKTVFAQLDKLIIGDRIEIANELTTMSYKVIDTKVIGASDISVVHQDLGQHRLTLITCWPPGTTEKRLVVVSDLDQYGM